MRLSRKTERRIRQQAATLKRFYESSDPEVDRIMKELKAATLPPNMTKAEELAYIMGAGRDIVSNSIISQTDEIIAASVACQRETTRRHAVEACKQMCPSRSSRGCMDSYHKRETKSTLCDGDCKRVKYFLNAMDKQEL